MKMQMLSLLTGLCLLAGCGAIQPGYSLEDATTIRIECKKDKILQMVIVQRLKLSGAKDISIDDEGAEMDIVASYRVVDVPMDTVYDIGDDLRQISGVIYVTVDKSPTVVRQTGFH